MKQVTKEQVILILGMMMILVTGVCLLAILDKDPTIILTITGLLAIPVLGALGVAVYQKLDQVKEVSNGNLTRAHDMLDKHTQQTADALAANTAVLSKLVETLTTTTSAERR
jgi:hypothetical protein